MCNLNQFYRTIRAVSELYMYIAELLTLFRTFRRTLHKDLTLNLNCNTLLITKHFREGVP